MCNPTLLQPGEEFATKQDLQVLTSKMLAQGAQIESLKSKIQSQETKIHSQEATIKSLQVQLKSKQGLHFCIIF